MGSITCGFPAGSRCAYIQCLLHQLIPAVVYKSSLKVSRNSKKMELYEPSCSLWGAFGALYSRSWMTVVLNRFGGNGLNIIEATRVLMVEPMLDRGNYSSFVCWSWCALCSCCCVSVHVCHMICVTCNIAGLEAQAINRVHRIGQTKPTEVAWCLAGHCWSRCDECRWYVLWLKAPLRKRYTSSQKLQRVGGRKLPSSWRCATFVNYSSLSWFQS